MDLLINYPFILYSLNMSRNGFGPNVAASLFHTLSHSNCTITDINFTDNPIGIVMMMRIM